MPSLNVFVLLYLECVFLLISMFVLLIFFVSFSHFVRKYGLCLVLDVYISFFFFLILFVSLCSPGSGFSFTYSFMSPLWSHVVCFSCTLLIVHTLLLFVLVNCDRHFPLFLV